MSSFVEAYLHKTISDLEYSDFLAFYKRRLEESQTLEYKSGEKLIGPKGQHIQNGRLNKKEAHQGFIDLATSIAGFANAQGGLFVLGIKELLVKDRSKQTIGKRPGTIFPIPNDHIQKEMIEDKLSQLIQFPIDNLSILPLRTTKRGKNYVYLIDVPPSVRIPHRVNQGDYPLRLNFETKPMVHYQINDLFYKRVVPDLDVLAGVQDFSNNSFKLRLVLRNSGRAVAKYPMCLVNIVEGPYTISANGANWTNQNPQVFQYSPGVAIIIYTAIPLDIGQLTITNTNTPPDKSQVTIRCLTCAEDATAKETFLYIDPNTQKITDAKITSPWISPYHEIRTP
jgi:hypothetical protein